MSRRFLMIALACLPGIAAAQASHDQHMNHIAQQMGITEPGQAAFGAIAEIVARLEADPETDWSHVDIDALRAHLLDMDLVTLRSKVDTRETPEGAVFRITGTGDTIGAIRRMTHAHAAMMQGAWRFRVSNIDGGAELAVSVPPAERPRLRGLGFFGIMASGMHHQMHHFMLATGVNPH